MEKFGYLVIFVVLLGGIDQTFSWILGAPTDDDVSNEPLYYDMEGEGTTEANYITDRFETTGSPTISESVESSENATALPWQDYEIAEEDKSMPSLREVCLADIERAQTSIVKIFDAITLINFVSSSLDDAKAAGKTEIEIPEEFVSDVNTASLGDCFNMLIEYFQDTSVTAEETYSLMETIRAKLEDKFSPDLDELLDVRQELLTKIGSIEETITFQIESLAKLFEKLSKLQVNKVYEDKNMDKELNVTSTSVLSDIEYGDDGSVDDTTESFMNEDIDDFAGIADILDLYEDTENENTEGTEYGVNELGLDEDNSDETNIRDILNFYNDTDYTDEYTDDNYYDLNHDSDEYFPNTTYDANELDLDENHNDINDTLDLYDYTEGDASNYNLSNADELLGMLTNLFKTSNGSVLGGINNTLDLYDAIQDKFFNTQDMNDDTQYAENNYDDTQNVYDDTEDADESYAYAEDTSDDTAEFVNENYENTQYISDDTQAVDENYDDTQSTYDDTQDADESYAYTQDYTSDETEVVEENYAYTPEDSYVDTEDMYEDTEDADGSYFYTEDTSDDIEVVDENYDDTPEDNYDDTQENNYDDTQDADESYAFTEDTTDDTEVVDEHYDDTQDMYEDKEDTDEISDDTQNAYDDTEVVDENYDDTQDMYDDTQDTYEDNEAVEINGDKTYDDTQSAYDDIKGVQYKYENTQSMDSGEDPFTAKDTKTFYNYESNDILDLYDFTESDPSNVDDLPELLANLFPNSNENQDFSDILNSFTENDESIETIQKDYESYNANYYSNEEETIPLIDTSFPPEKNISEDDTKNSVGYYGIPDDSNEISSSFNSRLESLDYMEESNDDNKPEDGVIEEKVESENYINVPALIISLSVTLLLFFVIVVLFACRRQQMKRTKFTTAGCVHKVPYGTIKNESNLVKKSLHECKSAQVYNIEI